MARARSTATTSSQPKKGRGKNWKPEFINYLVETVSERWRELGFGDVEVNREDQRFRRYRV